MAEIVQEKSRGLKFAEEQLLRHGWEQGKGLGRDENGISEAIKVKVKCDKGGVGHKQGEQFTFHWWDHVFNKASASLQVESDQNGVLVKKTVEEEDDGAITNRKPRKAALAKAMLYGCFVKSATLLSGQEQPEPKALSSDDNSSSSSSSSEDEDQRLDLSSTTKLSDAELIKACGGRTAHKGARHGLTMNAKLARLEQQEAEFMAKYGKKSQSGNTSPECSTPSVQSAAQSPEREEEAAGMEFQKKMSKKTKKEKKPAPCHENVTTVSESQETDVQLKKKKKKKRKEDCEEASGEVAVTVSPKEEFNPLSNTETDHHVNAKTKHKKKKEKKNREEREVMTSGLTPGSKSTSVMREDGEEQEASTEPQTDMDAKAKKKKKKSSKRHEERLVPAEVDQGHDTESNLSDPLSVSTRKNKRKAEGGDGEAEEDATLKKKKKKKHSEVVEIQTDVVNSEAVAPQKKKKKKTKEQKMEQD